MTKEEKLDFIKTHEYFSCVIDGDKKEFVWVDGTIHTKI